jgi:leucyl aminopeptidase
MKYRLALLNLVLAAVIFVRAAPITHEEIIESSAKGLHLLQLTENDAPVWKTDEEELELKREGINFVGFDMLALSFFL